MHRLATNSYVTDNRQTQDCSISATVSTDWIVQCFTSRPTQYRLYGRRFLQVKRPNQQYQGTEGTVSTVG